MGNEGEAWAAWLREQFDRHRTIRRNADLVRAAGEKDNGRPVIDGSTVTQWLRGRPPSYRLAVATAEAFGVPPEEALRAAGYEIGDHSRLEHTMRAGREAAEAVDVLTAIEMDPNLITEAKQHLRNQYELLLRIPELSEQRGKSQRGRKTSDPRLRAVARGGRPEDQAEVGKLARQARRDFEEAKRERNDDGGGRR